MKRLSASLKIYILLVLILAVSNAIQAYLQPYGETAATSALPASPPVLALVNAGIAIVLYGGLGLLGANLAPRLGFADIWDRSVNQRSRFIIPALTGGGLGAFFIITDLVFSRYNGIGRFTHPSFPSSFFASLSAGIGEEIIFRLFFITVWCWLIGRVSGGVRGRNTIFWIIAGVAALAFALGHLPTIMYLYGYASPANIPPVLFSEIILLNGLLGLVAAGFLRRSGFLAAAGVHFWTDIIWHVAWGFFATLI